MFIPTPTCPDEGPHSDDGTLYIVEYAPRAVRDYEYACTSCISRMRGARKGAKLRLDSTQTSNAADAADAAYLQTLLSTP